MSSFNSNKKKILDLLHCQIDDSLLYSILFEMNRYFDKDLTNAFQEVQKKYNRVFNQKERNILRKYFYYKQQSALKLVEINEFPSITYNNKDVEYIINECISRCETYGNEKIINSIKERKNNVEHDIIVDNSEKWLDYYYNKVSESFEYSLMYIQINQDDFKNNDYSFEYYYNLIASTYEKLENYRNLIIKIKCPLFDSKNNDVSWQLAYKLGIYCENFIMFKNKFFPFKKDKSIEKLSAFLNKRFNDHEENLKLSEDFYSSISTGFKYEDCYISDTEDTILLSYKKIALDESPVPCPSCMTTIQSGNSYPELFLRSYECKNPNCPDRSKSGRGKRFDEFGIYRYSKLVEDIDSNKIEHNLYEKWRRDIFSHENDVDEMIIKYYAWNNEKICIYPNTSSYDKYERHIIPLVVKDISLNNYCKNYDELPIIKLMNSINKKLNRNTGNINIEDDLAVINDDSAKGIRSLKANQVGSAITSPPYYNAREYSQWQNLVMYLIDMMINASSVYDTLIENGYYLYNIGDIVNTDNIYVESNMSKKRLQLGFLSCAFFEIVGFNLVGNIIWDKGQVQSKRNTTVNLNSGYVKCINCYEHVFVLKKGYEAPNTNNNKISIFTPVIKINSKGENLYKHTAPYPPEMVDLLKPYIAKDKYVLDPFLGSGTTVLWCKNNGYKGIGFELNNEYYKLCLKRIFNSQDDNTECNLFNINE